MESLYLLIPMSVGLVLIVLGIFAWALHRGQFEDLEGEAERILGQDPNEELPGQAGSLDLDQTGPGRRPEESTPVKN